MARKAKATRALAIALAATALVPPANAEKLDLIRAESAYACRSIELLKRAGPAELRSGECILLKRGQKIHWLTPEQQHNFFAPHVRVEGDQRDWYISWSKLMTEDEFARAGRNLEALGKEIKELAIRAKSNPPPAPQIARSHTAFDRAESTQLVANLLSEAGVTGYRLINPTDAKIPNLQVVWVLPTGVVGGFRGARGARQMKIDDLAPNMIAQDTRLCAGNFASGKKRAFRTLEGAEILKIFTACDHGQNSFEAHYSIIKTPAGELLTFVHFTAGHGKSEAAAQADDHLVRSTNPVSAK
jgi:hypothetical protein